jgi:coproporphyrinogen III oxidase-like Fe-S oxidoreductase
MIEKDGSAIIEETKINAASEFVFLGLRLRDGINLNEYEKRFGIDLIKYYEKDLRRLQEFDLIELNGNFLKLTSKGFLFSNEVFEAFV